MKELNIEKLIQINWIARLQFDTININGKAVHKCINKLNKLNI